MTTLGTVQILETLLWIPASHASLVASVEASIPNSASHHLPVQTPRGPSIVLFWHLHLDRLSKALSQLPVNLGLGSLPQEAVQLVTDAAQTALLTHVVSKAASLDGEALDQPCLRIRLLVDLNGQPTVESTSTPFPPTLSWSLPAYPLPSSSPPLSIEAWWTQSTLSVPTLTMYLDLSHPISALDQPTLSPFPHDFLIHKTTHRTIYDSAQSHAKRTLQLGSAAWVDVLLHTNKGFVTESCIANIAVLSPNNHQWITPQIDVGRGNALLPGCMRFLLLNARVVQEGDVPLSWITEHKMPVVGFNSVRGCFPVEIKVMGVASA